MRLFLVRHAHSDPGDPDELRPLSARGREQARELGERLAPVEPELVLDEPAAARAGDGGRDRDGAGAELRVDERLAPGATRGRRARGDRGRRRAPSSSVGHQPDCSRDRGRARRRAAASRLRAVVRGRAAAVTAISVRGLRKSYDGVEAVRGIDFEVAAGEVFGLLGPNGAGKTTTVEILEGYRPRDAGEVDVLGFDPARRSARSASGSASCCSPSELWPMLTVREIHGMFAGYYKHPRDVDEVIELVGLDEKRNAQVKTLSGGQKRRLDLGIALVGDPELVFLDEPTTGFDPAARRNAWELVRSLRGLGKTVLLTTHYLDEAQQLADRVAVIVAGEIVRIGKPSRADRRHTRADPLPARRRGDRRRDGGADADAARADRAARSRTASSSKGSRCAGRRSRTSTSTSSPRRDA